MVVGGQKTCNSESGFRYRPKRCASHWPRTFVPFSLKRQGTERNSYFIASQDSQPPEYTTKCKLASIVYILKGSINFRALIHTANASFVISRIPTIPTVIFQRQMLLGRKNFRRTGDLKLTNIGSINYRERGIENCLEFATKLG